MNFTASAPPIPPMPQRLRISILKSARDFKAERWECTIHIYKTKGFVPYRLDACCERLGIPLNHHETLSDAIGCAQLYLKR